MSKKKAAEKAGDKNSPEMDDLKNFIQRKKIQNKALKKIIDKINEKGNP